MIGDDNEPVCVPAGSRLIYPEVDGTIINSAGVIIKGIPSPHLPPLSLPPLSPLSLLLVSAAVSALSRFEYRHAVGCQGNATARWATEEWTAPSTNLTTSPSPAAMTAPATASSTPNCSCASASRAGQDPTAVKVGNPSTSLSSLSLLLPVLLQTYLCICREMQLSVYLRHMQ